MDITSLQNPRVKHIVRLREEKRQRREDGLMLVEGYDEIGLALASGFVPQTMLYSPELVSAPPEPGDYETVTVSRSVFEKMSYRQNPDGWLAVFPIPVRSLAGLMLRQPPLIIVAEAVEKPGNLGGILRTADAAGVDALLVCDPRADLWNPNVVRASRGAVFSVPAVECDASSALNWLKAQQVQVLAATPVGEALYSQVDLRGPVALAVGTEDQGLSDLWMSHADVQVRIPMMGRVNSLNVSVSTALLVYEAVRQRGLHSR